ncbi:MAG: hypothetical protein MZU97_02755 [Bacillus subtilis]|nr:hypothetical protein [Bacillus subtilis]
MARGGPRLDSRLGPLRLSASYFQAATFGETPFNFDRFDYGKSNLVFDGDLKLHRLLSVGRMKEA